MEDNYPPNGVKLTIDEEGWWKYTATMKKWYLHGSTKWQKEVENVDQEKSWYVVDQWVSRTGLQFIVRDHSSGFAGLKHFRSKFHKTPASGIFSLLNQQALIKALPDTSMKSVPVEVFPAIAEAIKEMDSSLLLPLASVFLRLNELGPEKIGADKALAFAEVLIATVEE